MKSKSRFALWRSVVMCLFVTLALGIRMEMPADAWGMTGVEAVVHNLSVSMQNYVFCSLVYGVLIYVDRAIEKRKQHRRPIYSVASFLIALLWLMSEGFRIDNTLNELSASAGQLIKNGFYLAGHTYLLTQLLYLLEWLLYEYGSSASDEEKQSSSTFGKIFFLLLLCWTPHWVLAYPGNICLDSLHQFRQFLGIERFTAHHPPIHTLMSCGLVMLGDSLGKAEWGLYAITLVQTAVAAAILAYSYLTLVRLHAPKWLRTFFFLVCLCSPYYTAYLSVMLKDVLYSYGFLLYTIELAYLLILGLSYFESKKHVLLLCLSTLMVYLFRNNGVYVLFGSTAVLLVFVLLKKKEPRRLRGACLIVMPLVLAMGVSTLITSVWHIHPTGIQEALSLPIQQTARYVKDHPNDVTPEERQAIDDVLQYDRLAKQYYPTLSDPAKGLIRGTPSTEQVITYLKTWARQFARHPFTYFKATLNQNYFLIYPFDPNPTVYCSAPSIQYGDLSITSPEWIVPVKETMNQIYQLLFALPVIGLISNPAFYVLVLIALCLYALVRKQHSLGILLWPALLSVLVVVLAPGIFEHPRYMFPVIYGMPVLIAYTIHSERKA